jgi:hypothetical protein
VALLSLDLLGLWTLNLLVCLVVLNLLVCLVLSLNLLV